MYVAVTAACLVAAAPAAPSALTADYYVAPGGHDDAAGTLAQPFASLDRARLAVRELRAREPQRTRPVTVLLRGGWYTLAAPIVFTPEDSGTEASPTVYAAYPGEDPILSGGTRLSGWKVADGRWTLDLPEVARGEWQFSQLFVNSARRYRPRLPRDSYYFIAADAAPTPASAGKGHDRFGFAGTDLRPDWHNLSDVEVCCFNHWNMHRLRIGAVDPGSRLVTFTGPTCSKEGWAALPRGFRYVVENVAEALSRPGEWYLDRPSGKLTYIPMPGEDPATAVVIAPRIEQLIKIEGHPEADKPVAWVSLEGLTFAHTNWNCPPKGNSFPQAEANLSAALSARGAQHWSLEGCTLAHLGAWGVELGEGCRDNRLERCTVADVGAGGIKIGTEGIPGNEKLYSGWTTVVDNTFAHGGRMHPAGIGVWIAHGPHNVVEHNDIFDFYYTGISVGWSWGYGKSLAHDNRFADNRVWQIGQAVLSDMGGIYTLGLSPGTTIEHNCFHDIDAFSYGGWGIYFDEGTSGVVARDNLVYRTKTGGFHQHYGENNLLDNNILAFARIGQLQRTRSENHLGFTLQHNLVYWDEGPLMHGNWGDAAHFKLDSNLYWNAAGDPIYFAGHSLDDWRKLGQDANSLVADPLFVDPAKGDFALRPGSPADKVGFKPFPLTGFGRRDDGGAWALKPVAAAFPAPPPPAPPTPINQDFEALAVGDKTPGCITEEDDAVKDATARVTDELACTGHKCLKLIDRPGQKLPWDPHIYFDPGFEEGRIEDSFDLRLGAGAALTHEWRDMTLNPYVTGPSITVGTDRKLRAGNRELLTLPQDTWVHLSLVGGLGPQQNGKWTIEVTVADQPVQRFADLPCAKLKHLHWLGWTSNGVGGVYWLDNLHVGSVTGH
jgi:hypothetical protein